jgi:hypothetical protein
MESGRVGSSPSTMPESREWADPFEMLESANGERNIHKEFMVLFVYRVQHKEHVYKEYHSVCPSSELGLSQPLSRQRVCPSPQNRGEG